GLHHSSTHQRRHHLRGRVYHAPDSHPQFRAGHCGGHRGRVAQRNHRLAAPPAAYHCNAGVAELLRAPVRHGDHHQAGGQAVQGIRGPGFLAGVGAGPGRCPGRLFPRWRICARL
ncbi:MAG: hypothetical protein AVDCRST_MAG56-2527, partial [uncultured Cytophagales bacterium]